MHGIETLQQINKTNLTKEEAMYLDWFNNYLTVEKFAEDYRIDKIEKAYELIKQGKESYNKKYN